MTRHTDTSLSAEQILERLRTAGFTQDDASLENDGLVWVNREFMVFEGEETHDAARRSLCDLHEDLEMLGLQLNDSDSDNDTIWGWVGERRTCESLVAATE